MVVNIRVEDTPAPDALDTVLEACERAELDRDLAFDLLAGGLWSWCDWAREGLAQRHNHRLDSTNVRE